MQFAYSRHQTQQHKYHNELYPEVCRAIESLCAPEVAQFMLDENGNIVKWLNKKAVQPTQTQIDAKIKELQFQSAQQAKVQELYQAYETANSQDIAYMNTTFQADKNSVDTLSKVLAVGSVPTGFYWVDSLNNKVPMTYADLQGLANAILVRNQVNFDKLQALKVKVKAATTLQDLEVILW